MRWGYGPGEIPFLWEAISTPWIHVKVTSTFRISGKGQRSILITLLQYYLPSQWVSDFLYLSLSLSFSHLWESVHFLPSLRHFPCYLLPHKPGEWVLSTTTLPRFQAPLHHSALLKTAPVPLNIVTPSQMHCEEPCNCSMNTCWVNDFNEVM